MSDNPRYATLRDYLRVLREQWLVIALITVVAGGVSFALSERQAKTYSSTAAIGFQDVSQQLSLLGGSVSPNIPAEQTPQARAQTIDVPPVVERTKRALHSNLPVGKLASAISTSVDQSSALVKVTVSWGDPAFAARLANEFARQAAADTNQKAQAQFAASLPPLRNRLDKLGSSVTDQTERAALVEQLTRLEFLSNNAQLARVVNTAQPSGVPASPKPKRNTVLGLLIGLALGIFVAFLRDSLDRRLRGGREVQSELSLPLLGQVRDEAMGHVVRTDNGHGRQFAEDVEAFRILRRNLEFLSVDSLRSILVTSALPEEGKSTVAASLAWSSVLAGKRTLLVECDFRRPDFAERMGLASEPGLTDYLARRAQPAEIIQTVRVAAEDFNGANGSVSAPKTGGLVCITAGTPSPEPTELLGSERFRDFLTGVSDAYDLVILDSSPLLSVADTLEVLPNVDAVLLCVRSSRTTREQALAAKAALDHYPRRPTGIVVTGLRRRDASDYGYYTYSEA